MGSHTSCALRHEALRFLYGKLKTPKPALAGDLEPHTLQLLLEV